MIGLLLTVVLLFWFQAEAIVDQSTRVLMMAIPSLIQSYGIFAIGYASARTTKLPVRRRRSDGFLDLVSHYVAGDIGLVIGDTEACLTGTTLGGIPIEDCDFVGMR